MSIARDERRQLVELMREVGPDAPTLCGQWTTRDLAAHLVVRERRLDAAPGILLPPLAAHTERVQQSVAAQDYARLLGDVESGPPIWSPFRLLDAQVNMTEMFVHHEDVRRARDGWEPRTLAPAVQAALWRATTMLARRSYRKSPVTVVLVAADGATATPVRRGEQAVALRGEPAELLLHAFGRDQVRVDFEGDPADVAAVQGLDRSV
ncbi:TIGR03085 family protein [Rhodococcus sp. D2-41]|uniref:TIGR03085 family metal-binding protein n=1 Tax=Speluncibacter jeojiensis TaxID=2710754 RepID=A0A9X4RCU0_9ACTN|nr:TIGR03085 family metal-binding protein [Rhodococcus sp. D2-41]MDG3010919.1 TIGR03085 family protein [Rhodococcus sp. D2-41]MDG3013894.1 TIGR03085 family metal-binding protein [Corynebacteriales bacterium D3-21]